MIDKKEFLKMGEKLEINEGYRNNLLSKSAIYKKWLTGGKAGGSC